MRQPSRHCPPSGPGSRVMTPLRSRTDDSIERGWWHGTNRQRGRPRSAASWPDTARRSSSLMWMHRMRGWTCTPNDRRSRRFRRCACPSERHVPPVGRKVIAPAPGDDQVPGYLQRGRLGVHPDGTQVCLTCPQPRRVHVRVGGGWRLGRRCLTPILPPSVVPLSGSLTTEATLASTPRRRQLVPPSDQHAADFGFGTGMTSTL